MGLTRRAFARASIAAALVAACERTSPPTLSPSASPSSPLRTPSPSPGTTSGVRRVLIHADAIADGTAAAPMRRVAVLLEGERIRYAGPRDGAPDATGAEVVDLAGATIVPALVDCHVHLTGTGGASAHARLQDGDAILLARAAENARLLASRGVLAVRDVGAVRGANVRARDALRSEVDVPIIAAAGTWIARRGRYVPFAIEVADADELRRAALAQLDAGADLVKIAVDGATATAATWSVSDLRPTVEAVHARGKTVAAHAQGYGSLAAAQAGVDTIEHGFVIDRATTEAMRARTTLVTSLSVAQAFGELDIALPSIRAARDAGVRIAVGTDAGGGPPVFGQFASEVALLVRAGLAPHAALAAATRAGGSVLGVAGLGTLDRGAPAHLVAVDGDPLADPAALGRVRAVWRAGRRIV